MKSANVYANVDLDRAAHLRRDAAWIQAKLLDGSSRILPIWRSRSLVVEGETPVSILLEPDRGLIAETQVVVFLGMMGEVAHFAIDVSHHEQPPFGDHGEFHDLRQVGPRMSPMEGGMIAYARAMMTWHKRHRFCGRCGSPTEIHQAGHVRKCSNPDCGLMCFPRTDPAVIMLVHDGGDRVVLGRKPTMMPGLHTILAGFVEPGESMEDAVAREVYEEVGLYTTDIHYHSSQPWPFPANIMLGFTARATTFDLTIDGHELEEGARWFTRDEVLNSPEDDRLRMPRVDSIARRLLDEWVEGG